MSYYKIPIAPNLLLSIRIACISLTLIYCINVNVYSLSFFVLTLISLYCCCKKSSQISQIKIINNIDNLENPFRKMKKAASLDQLPKEIIEKAKLDLINYIVEETNDENNSLKAFEPVKSRSNCLFARRANLWGAKLWNQNLNLDENVHLFLPSFILFCHACTNLKLDGFVVQMSGNVYGRDVQVFAKAFCQVLSILSQCDPKQLDCMRRFRIDRPGWVFEFCKQTFFITTFAPFYPATHSRHTFDVDECFILFQPEVSFAHHNLPVDTPQTNWTEPQTVRDKIRIAFKEADREYLIRQTVRYPMAYDMIKPLSTTTSASQDDDEIIKWWQYANN